MGSRVPSLIGFMEDKEAIAKGDGRNDEVQPQGHLWWDLLIDVGQGIDEDGATHEEEEPEIRSIGEDGFKARL